MTDVAVAIEARWIAAVDVVTHAVVRSGALGVFRACFDAIAFAGKRVREAVAIRAAIGFGAARVADVAGADAGAELVQTVHSRFAVRIGGFGAGGKRDAHGRARAVVL